MSSSTDFGFEGGFVGVVQKVGDGSPKWQGYQRTSCEHFNSSRSGERLHGERRSCLLVQVGGSSWSKWETSPRADVLPEEACAANVFGCSK